MEISVSDVAAFQQQQLRSQGKRHVASQECGGTAVSQPPNRKDSRPLGRRRGMFREAENRLFCLCVFLT